MANEDSEESVWSEMKLTGNDKLLIGCIYRSPNSTIANDAKINELLRRASGLNFSHLLVFGDLNHPSINWLDNTSPPDGNHPASLFMDSARDAFLTQHVTEPTHYRGNNTPNTLDLIFTNEEGMLEHLKYLAPVGSSHHSLLKFDFCCYTKTDRPRVNKYKYDRGNYDSMRDTMATRNWEHEFHNKSTEQRWGILEKAIKKTCDKHIPMRKAGSQTGLNMRPMWTNGRTMEAVKKKTEAYRLYREYRDEQHFIEYRRASNKVKTEVRNAVREFEKQIAGEAKRNPKAFYRYARSKMKTKSTVGDLERLDGTMADTDVQKAEVLNSFFASVFTTEGEGDIPQFERRTYNTELVDLSITKEGIERILKTLNTSKSPGPDGLHPRPLAEMAAQLAEPFQALFSTSLEEGILPQGWKDGNVTPIFKKGKKHQPGNYRPVSLTSIPCRIMEKLVRNEIMEHLINNNLLSKFQHGFIKARSCTTQLLAVLDDWTDVIEHGENVDAIYLDYAKAFDTVPHKRLLAKLYG